MNKKYLGSLGSILTIVMAAMLSISLTSCGSDDDADNNRNSSFLVGEWQECNSKGVFKDDATDEEVHHARFRANGTGDYWTVTKGKEDEYKYSFEYSCSLKGTSGTLTLITTSSIYSSETGRCESAEVTYVNGILHGGDIYYKKK